MMMEEVEISGLGDGTIRIPTIVDLGNGRVAYVDKNGSVLISNSKEELLSSSPELVNISSNDIDSNRVPIPDRVESEFIFTDFFTDAIEDSQGIHNEVPTSSVDLLSLNSSQVEDDFVEQVTMFKCRACTFTAAHKSSIVEHFSKEHAQNVCVRNDTSLLPQVPSFPLNKEFERLAQCVSEEPSNHEKEKLLYVCGKCQDAFETIELCRQHMIQEHKYISGKSKLNSTLPESTNLSSTGSQSQDSSPANVQNKWNEPCGNVEPSTGEQADKLEAKITCTSGKLVSILNTSSSVADENSKLLVHKVRHKERNVKCTVRGCPFKFSDQKSLQIHLSCHSKNSSVKEFHCIHCSEKFVRWRLCSAHLWRVHQVDVDLFTCPVCKIYKSLTPMKLEIHMRTHGDQRPFCCKLCPKSFKQAAQLRNHSTSVHGNKTGGESVPRWYMEQKCTLCDKTYADAKCLKKHIQAVHSKMKPYVCSVCGHSSACRAMLALHLRQHTGEKPHACTHCDYRTGDHNTLRRHMMRHTGQRKYKCPHCPYAAIQSNSIKAHLRSRHPGESGVYTCSICLFQTVSQESLDQHLSDHQKGLISQKEPKLNENSQGDEVEYFPGNVAAAHLVYRCLGPFLQGSGNKLLTANITESQTSADGSAQSITIQIPTRGDEIEDEESSHSFLLKGADDDVGIDTGGITIPAEPVDIAFIES